MYTFQILVIIISSLLILILFSIPITILFYRLKVQKVVSKRKPSNGISIGIFHPYCNDGGGGERVLWTAVAAILESYPNTKLVIYTGDVEYSPDKILHKAKQRFNIDLPNNIEFVYLSRRKWIEAYMYPYFTLLGQSLGSVLLGFEALMEFCPDLYLDTMGYAFTYPIFKYIGQCKVACYTHYPTITSDMLRRVSGRVVAHNNRRIVANSPFLTAGKLMYYVLFSWMYRMVGKCADVVMVNSTWTEDHINDLWDRPLCTHRVYPPCNVDKLMSIERDFEQPFHNFRKTIGIISIGQFRPEKNHPLMLRAMYKLRQLLPEPVWERVRLVFIGACRNAEDNKRVEDMKDLCKHLSIEDQVCFIINSPYENLLHEIEEASIGLHAMWNEHFGIGVVECLAAGLITVAHRSGGPKTDIIIESEGSRNGFLADDDDDYAHTLANIIKMTAQQRLSVVKAARSSVDRFSEAEFKRQFLRILEPFFHKN